MKKRTVAILASALFAVGLIAGVAAADVIRDINAQLRPDFTIKIDGVTREFKNVDGEVVYPILYEGTTYLPIRAVGELMGKTVYWYEDDKRIELVEEKTPTVTDADVIVDSGTTKASAETTAPPKGTQISEPEKPAKEITGDLIGADKAKKIALEKAGLTAGEVIFDRVELDKDDGRYEYDVEFYANGYEFNYEIDAATGEIIKSEKDID